jgi:cellobiose phosphorylase
MIYKFTDRNGTFEIINPQTQGVYFPLTNKNGTLLSSISPNLSGDIKQDNDHFLTPPASAEDLRGNLLCRRDFFIRVNRKNTLRLSALPSSKIECGFLYHKIYKQSNSLAIEITNFIPHELDAEVMQIKIKNCADKAVEITPTSFLPLFGRSEKNIRDHRHVSSLLNRIYLDKFGILLKPSMIFDEKGHAENNTVYFVFGYEGNRHPAAGQFPTLDYFCQDGDLTAPQALEKNLKPLNKKIPGIDGKEACAAFRFKDKFLKPQEEASYYLIMGIAQSRPRARNLFLKLNTPLKINLIFQETKKYWIKYNAQVEFDFKDHNYNNWLLWVKFQPTLRKLFGCSFLPHFDYGKGGRGWRDLWQDALALIMSEPEKSKALIINNFKGVRLDGSNATIITAGGEFISDRNRISRVWMDHGIWPYLTTGLYINKTDDLGILLKEITYFKDGQIERGKGIDLNFKGQDLILRTSANKIYRGSILEHILIQHLVQFFNVGEHNVIRLENADWNDGLDMASQRGESVTFSFMYAHNLGDLCKFLTQLKKKTKSLKVLKELALLLDRKNQPIDYSSYKAKQKRLCQYFQSLRNLSGKKIKINIDDLIEDLEKKHDAMTKWLLKKEWLPDAGIFNGYYDNLGRRVEGRSKGRLRIMLASQVFALMSGIADPGQIKSIWRKLKSHLWDKDFAGFRLNTDFKDTYLNLGRSFGFSYGDKENGAFFNHMNVMLANALYRRGFRNEGFQVLDSIFKMSTACEAKIYPMIPEYFNGCGQGLYHYLTGSASWYVHTLMEEVLGIKFNMGSIHLEPKLLEENFFGPSIKVRIKLSDKIISFEFVRPKKEKGICLIKELYLNNFKVIPKQGFGYIINRQSLKDGENKLRLKFE